MDNRKTHIDALFKDKLQDFEAIPNAALWKEISKNIPQKKKKNNRLLFLAFPAGIAASLALFFMLTTLSKSNNESVSKTSILFTDSPCPEVDTENTIKIVNNAEKTSVKPNSQITANQKSFVNSSTTKNKFVKKTLNNAKNTDSKSTNEYIQNLLPTEALKNSVAKNLKPSIIKTPEAITRSAILNQITSKNKTNSSQQIVEVPSKNKKNTSEIDFKRTPQEDSSKDLEKNIEKDQQKALKSHLAITKENKKTPTKVDRKNWSIQPQIAPLAYNSLSGGSSINSDFSNNPQTSEAALSYGIRIAYQLSNKIQIRSGISTASINLATNDIFSSSLASNNTAILFNNSDAVSNLIGEEAFSNLDEFTGRSFPPTVSPSSTPENSEELNDPNSFGPLNGIPSSGDPISSTRTTGSLQQQINYIEIPLEVSYRLLNKQLGISLIGGVSSFILTQKNDQLLFEISGNTTEIGEAKNLNNTSFSGNFGIGLDYKIAPNIKLSVEPIFKLQFNAFDSNTEFDPYLFGIYSGIKFDL